jgi:hypothetical protein
MPVARARVKCASEFPKPIENIYESDSTMMLHCIKPIIERRISARLDRTIGDDMKIFYAVALTLSAVAAPVMAQPVADSAAAAPAISKGAMIFSADGRRIGRVDRVRATSVSIIYSGRFIEIPLGSLTPADKGYTTSLNKADLGKL